MGGTAALSRRLEVRKSEIAQAILIRLDSLTGPVETSDPEYWEGLRAAVCAAIDYALAAIEFGEERSPPIPTVLLAQARLAARHGVGLDSVLRRYFAGHALLDDCLVEEAAKAGLADSALRHLLRAQATLFDRLLATVSEEHAREVQSCLSTSRERRAQRVERLLAGELLDTSGLAYDFQASHVGLIASGPSAAEAVGELSGSLDRRLLLVYREGGTVWAWLGSHRPADPAEVQRLAEAARSGGTRLAIGEPGVGIAGWRFTHQQAKSALPIALRGRDPVVRYADVALLASALQDDLLSTSLREHYLGPLKHERDGGAVAKATLRAYFSAGRSISAAAAALKIKRHTVTNRLRVIEEKLGCRLDAFAVELEVALLLDDLDSWPVAGIAPARLA